MLLLGLLLVGSAAAFTCLLVAYNSSGGPAYDVVMFGQHLATMNGLRIFLSGVALALVFGIGCAMLLSGTARARSQRMELREVRAEARRTAAERDALVERLDASGPAAGPETVTPVTPVVTREADDLTAQPAVDTGDRAVPATVETPAETPVVKQSSGLRSRFSH